MASRGTNAKILIDEFNFSCDTNSLTVSGSVPALDSTALCDVATTFEIGIPTGMIEHAGYLPTAGAGTIHDEIYDRIAAGTATVYVGALLLTDIAACPGYVCQTTWANQLTIGSQNESLMTLAGSWNASGGFVRGLRLADGALSAVQAETAYDTGAAGTAGGQAFLFVSAIGGTATGATIDVESSATEGGAYDSEGTFTLSAVGVQKITMTGTVNRWLRINVTSLGGASSITAICIAGVSGVTY